MCALRPQAADGYHEHAVGASVGQSAYSGQHHFERRSEHTVGIYFAFKLFQGGCAFFNQFLSTKFYLHQTIMTISQMHHRIAFQTVLIPEMINVSIQYFCIDAQITNGKCLKQQSHRVQVIDQILWADAQGGHGN